MAVTIGQAGFRLRNDDGNETTATWMAAQNTNVQISADKTFRVRFLMQNSGSTASNNLVAQLEYQLNGGASTNVNASSSVVRSAASPNLADAANITQQLTGGTGTFIGLTGYDEVDGAAGGASLDVPASGNFEVEYSISIRGVDITNGDTINLRFTNAGTDFTGSYAQVPAITATKPVFSKFDDVAAAESITVFIPRLVPAVSEDLTIVENITVSKTGTLPLTTDQSDSVIAYDLSNQEINYWITVTDAITPRLMIQPQPFETVSVAESISLTGSLSLNQFETVAAAEDITVKPFIQPQPFETIGAAEDVTITGRMSLDQFETVGAGELIALLVFHLFVSAGEDVTIAESITVSTTAVGMLAVNTSESLTLAEIGQALLTSLFIDTNDAVSVAEAATPLVNQILASVSDTATLAELAAAILGQQLVNTSDSVAVGELATLQFSRLFIAADEAVSLAESISFSFVAPLSISVYDLVQLLSIVPVEINTQSELITVSDFVIVVGPLLWASVGSLGSAGSKSANQASLTLVTTAPFEVGRFAVVLIAVDNFSGIDGDEVAVTGLVDSAGNTYLKAREFTNGQGGSQAGACVSVWYCKASAQLNTGGTITASFSNATSRDASAISAFKFATAATGAITLAGSAVLANDNADPGSLDLTLAFGEYLWIRAQAHERPSTDTFTKTVAYGGTFDKNGTSGGTAATNMTVAGEWDIALGTSNASNPAWSLAADESSVLVAFRFDPALAPSMSDAVSVAELAAISLPKLFIDTNDPIVIAEIITLELGGLIGSIPVSIFDAVTLAELAQAAFSRLSIDTNDAVTVADFVSTGAAVDNIFVELGDVVAISENIIFRGRLSINAFDFVFLYAVSPAQINIADSLNIADFVAALGPTTVGLNILAFENVVVDIPETGVFESIAVGELAQVAGTGLDWFSIGSLGSVFSNSADQPSIVLQAGAVAEVGNVVVLLIAVDNAATSDGDEGAVTGISDASGNQWIKAGEFCNANAAAQAGATISAWYSQITTQINLNALITASFSNTTSRDASALTAWEFGRRQSGAVSVAAVSTLANDNSDPGLMNLALTGGEHLWIRAQAHEGPLSDTWIKTAVYDGIFDKQGTTGGIAANNMTVAAEFRIFTGTSNPSDPSWTAAADEAGILFALRLSPALAPSAADSVIIAELATLSLARLTITLGENLTVSDAVLFTPSANLNVFEAVTVAELSALLISIRPTVFDALTLTDAVTLASQMGVTAADVVTVADAVVPSISAYLNVFEAVSIAELASIPIPILLVTSDSVSLDDAATMFFPKLAPVVFEDVPVLDVFATFIVGTAPAPGVGDFILAADDVQVSLNRLILDTSDSIAATDAVSLTSQMSISANDAVSVAEAITPDLLLQPISFDAVTLSDASTIPMPIPAQAFENVLAIEVLAFSGSLSFAVGDDVAIGDDLLISTKSLLISEQDSISLADIVAASIKLRINENELLAVTEGTTAIFRVQTIFIEQGDTVIADEEINQEVRGEGLLATELVAIDEFISLFLDKLTINAGEDVAAVEDLTHRLSVYVSLTDDVTVADEAAYIFHGTTLEIALGENVTVSERLSTNISLLKIVEVMSEIALELDFESQIAAGLSMTTEINQDIDLEGEIEI